MQKQQDAGENSHSTDANNLVRVVLVVVVRVTIGQVHVPRVVSVVGNRRSRPENSPTNFVSLNMTALGLQLMEGTRAATTNRRRNPFLPGRSCGTRRIQTHARSPDRIKTHRKLLSITLNH